MKKPKYHIAVTGLNAIDSPGPGISIIRALREAKSFDVRIIGLSYETLEPGIYMHDLVDYTYQIPYPSAGQQTLLDRIDYINNTEHIDFLFPNFDAELYNFIKIAAKLEKNWNIKMFLPTMKQFEDREKVNLMVYGKKHGIEVPKDRQIVKVADMYSLGEEFSFPVVVKGKFYESGIAYNTDQAVQLFHKISSKWGLPVLVQEFVYGTEVNVCGVGDGNGNLIGAVPMRKLYITDKGKAWTGISIDDEELLKITNDWMKSTHWRGPFELEVMKTTDDVYYLMEINPRFPAWVYLTNGCGQNQVEAVVNMAMGKEVKPFRNYEVGKMFIRYSYDMIVDINEFEKISTTGEI
jgi:carbamoyl-phosphate synthase large subunit